MIRFRFVVSLLLCLRAADLLQAQTYELQDQVEAALYLDESPEVPSDLLERMESLKNRPIDVNLATRDALYASGIFTPFQAEVLIRHRERYGPLFSVYELACLPGFRSSRLQEIRSCITVGSRTAPPSRSIRKGWALLETGTALPVPETYHPGDSLHPEPAYAGNPFRIKGRIRADPSGLLSLGAAYEKDPGELFLSGKKPEFLSGFIAYRGSRWFKQLVAGTYRIHHGLGLVNGTGLFHALEKFSLQPLAAPMLSPSASLMENRYERGIAVQLELGKIRWLCWSSMVPMDLSLHQFQPTALQVDWEQMERISGLHRTTTERSGRSLAIRIHQGTLATWRNHRWRLEVMGGIRINGLTKAGKDSLGVDPGYTMRPCGSLYAGRFGDRLQFSAEVAASTIGASAFQVVAGVRFSDFLSGLLLLHHYGSGFRGMVPSSYGAGSKVNNEEGIAWSWHLEPDCPVVADVTIELFRFPDPVQHASIPSLTYRYGCNLSNTGNQNGRWKIRAWKKRWQQTDQGPSSGPAPLNWAEVTRLDMQYRQLAGSRLQWDSRVVISWFSPSPEKDPAYATAQQVTWTPSTVLKLTMQFLHYRVAAWENRIYLHEPGLYYHFKFPVCYGSGEKIAAVCSLKPTSHLTFSCKMATLLKHDQTPSASGDRRPALKRSWDLALQVRLQF